jgi:hypothetical protein
MVQKGKLKYKLKNLEAANILCGKWDGDNLRGRLIYRKAVA